jgi:hypothetical protein
MADLLFEMILGLVCGLVEAMLDEALPALMAWPVDQFRSRKKRAAVARGSRIKQLV